MATRMWQDDFHLKEMLRKYVRQGLQRNEILDYMTRDFSYYLWSLRTLDRRLRYFNIYYVNKALTVMEVKDAVLQEVDGPGKLLGYRAMQNKIRQKYGLLAPRDKIYDIMYELDPDGLEQRRPGLKKKRAKTGFTTKGPNWVFSVDGHDKLMGYQNSTFPLAIYGAVSTLPAENLCGYVYGRPTLSQKLLAGGIWNIYMKQGAFLPFSEWIKVTKQVQWLQFMHTLEKIILTSKNQQIPYLTDLPHLIR